MVIETPRLFLREMAPEDFDALYTVLADSDIMQHDPYTFDEGRVRNWIGKNMERYRVFGFGLWAVILKEENRLIGDCGMAMQCVHGKMLPEIGYHIHRGYQRRGYASEAASRCLQYAFEDLQLPEVYSYMKYDNKASCGVAKKNGMRLVETYPDELITFTRVYAITREEWLAAHVSP